MALLLWSVMLFLTLSFWAWQCWVFLGQEGRLNGLKFGFQDDLQAGHGYWCCSCCWLKDCSFGRTSALLSTMCVYICTHNTHVHVCLCTHVQPCAHLPVYVHKYVHMCVHIICIQTFGNLYVGPSVFSNRLLTQPPGRSGTPSPPSCSSSCRSS